MQCNAMEWQAHGVRGLVLNDEALVAADQEEVVGGDSGLATEAKEQEVGRPFATFFLFWSMIV